MKNFQVRQILILFLIFYFTQVIFSQQNNNSNLTVSINGKFFKESSRIGEKASSGNGIYWCTYKIGHVSDEVRQLKDFTLYENDIKLYSIKLAPGSDVYISNSGIAAFINMKEHFKQKITIIFFSKAESKLLSESFNGASHFGFSPEGEVFGVGTPDNIFIISVMKNRIEKYGKGFQFDISENEELVAIASKNKVKVFSHKKLINKFKTGFMHTRKIKISKKNNILAVIDKKNLKVYSLTKKNLLFSSRLKGENSFRDLLIEHSQIYTGIHYRCDGISKGILRKYDLKGMILSEREDVVKQFKTFEKQDNSKNTTTEYPPIPWPFVPFDSMHTVWNHYEQHMGGYGSDFSYLHQGLDLITPIGEPTYAVAEGYVKCVLTLGGAVYWRIAVGRENSAGYSNGWLYAHLIESTIQFDVGDTVQIHDYLGDIIQWADDWGHIHFAEIRDTGLVWQYDDNEWGITYNPQLSLIPNTDTIPPVIDNIFPEQKFAFCLNETSTYLDPDSLYGDIDIIIKVIDYAGDSPWQQPAFTTYYQVKKIPEGNIVFPRTLGQILNHSYNFYSSGNYEPYATILYKRDEYLFPSSWMDME
ncbi:MAG: hypothetical protein KAR38_16740, partial [Calditrichia bacterium]|nr:hypothetical protein [Calditrichia bacterium]